MKHVELLQEAEQFIRDCYRELGKNEAVIEARLQEIQAMIEKTGTYEHTFTELEHGARMAWRNSNRCIGRLFWGMLHVFDERRLQTAADIHQALLRHIQFATNDGRIRPAITIFKQQQSSESEVKIWNHQLLRYAGYETEHGIIGDAASLAFTKECEQLGWRGAGTSFDLLPLVVQVNGKKPVWADIPKEFVHEVAITHPEFAWFQDFRLKWYGVPIIADMKLEVGGITYTAAPFNGWYMETEIGARNLADADRYNMLPAIAERMGLDMSRNATLWKDKALIELNIAVLHSFKQAGVTIVDHHTAAQQFKQFENQEQAAGRDVTGSWIWLIPPVSPATTHIYHKNYQDTIKNPNYYYQDKPYEGKQP